MKLRTIIETFDTLTKVYNSLNSFDRKWELIESYKELKEAVKLFNDQRTTELESLKVNGKLSPENIDKANVIVEKIAASVITLKHPLLFTKEEVKQSNITGPELVLIIDDFVKK